MDDWRDDYSDEPLDDYTVAGTFDEWADERARAGSASGPGETDGES